MRAVVQRAGRGSVTVGGEKIASTGPGAVILAGVGKEDTPADVEFLAEKIANLRIFSDQQGKMNLSLLDTAGEALVVPQFTLYGDCRRGRRPGFDHAAPPEKGEEYYRMLVDELRSRGVSVATGMFQAHMELEIINDGPVTLLLDSSKQF